MQVLQEVTKVQFPSVVCSASGTVCSFYSHGCKMAAASPGNRSTFQGGRAEGKKPESKSKEFVSFQEHFPKPHPLTSVYISSLGHTAAFKGNWANVYFNWHIATPNILKGLLGKKGGREGRREERRKKW